MTATQLGRVSLLIGLLFFPFLSWAYAPPLKINGIDSNGKQVAITLSRGEIEQLPQHKLSTHLPWFEGQARFEGVRLSVLLTTFSLEPERISFTALNDYQVDVSQEYIEKYQPLVAIKKNGNYLKVRDYGPYWLVASIDDYPELSETKQLAKMVWQIELIDVK
ncbi:oxidoreductase [Photobacterium sanctipauli]|nr:oxidoreductase [Photobacterium sanctipauli]